MILVDRTRCEPTKALARLLESATTIWCCNFNRGGPVWPAKSRRSLASRTRSRSAAFARAPSRRRPRRPDTRSLSNAAAATR
eukprot:31297-Pelagococcus_subviridis.AAC.10